MPTESKLTRSQFREITGSYQEDRQIFEVRAKFRYDDECWNGHNTFAVTANVYILYKSGKKEYISGGCCHDEIAKALPEFAHLIKWHLCSTDQPMHYIANTIYHAGDRDCWGLRKGESRQIINGRTKLPCWILSTNAERYVDSETRPEAPIAKYEPLLRVGEGKERDLKAARSTAIWPEATDEDLCSENLKELLLARHPKLMENFRKDMEDFGFVW